MPADLPEQFLTASPEVTRYFREKGSRPTFDWRDIAPAEHAYAFTVAKSAGFDVLDDLRAAVDDAIVNRVPFEAFRERLTPILQAKGWWGKRFAKNPADGETKLVQLGSPRRLRTIYWANIRTAHAAGEWERTQRTKRFLPYLVYTLSLAERRRPEHRAWVGVILPVDHPFWDTHYPPNGWGCKCGVRQISRREAERLGYDPQAGGPQIVLRPWRNKRTGQTVNVPLGIDPGWDTNPGKTRGRNVAELLSGRLGDLSTAARRAAIADFTSSPTFKVFVQDAIDTGLEHAALAPTLRAQGLKGFDLRDKLEAARRYAMTRFPVAIAPGRLGDDYLPIMIDARTIGHAADHRRVVDVSAWPDFGDILKRARLRRDLAGSVRAFDPQSGLFMVLDPQGSHWRLRTLYRPRGKARYFDKQPGTDVE
jgi:hypothetical protein